MENKKSGHMNEKELDRLLNEAFLNLDFETNIKNKEALSMVATRTMTKNSWSAFFGHRFNVLFLLVTFFLCLISFYNYIHAVPVETQGVIVSVSTPAPIKKQDLALAPEKKEDVKHSQTDVTAREAVPAAKQTYATKNSRKELKKIIVADTFVVTKETDTTQTSRAGVTKIENKDSATVTNTVFPATKGRQARTTTALSNAKGNTSSKKRVAGKPDAKVKVAKRRKGRRFFKDGTFRMRNRKYGKSR